MDFKLSVPPIPLPVNRGGTGQTSFTNGQLLIGNSIGNTLTKASLTGTANQITITPGPGSITLSTPQDIGTGSNVVFGSLTSATVYGSTSSGGTLTLTSTSNATKGKIYFGTLSVYDEVNDRLGIGTASPNVSLEVYRATPILRLAANSTTNYTNLEETANRFAIEKTYASGIALLDFAPLSTDGTSAATIRLFRSTNTTGTVGMSIYKGNNSTTVNSFLAGSGNSYLCANNGNIGIGTASPNAVALMDLTSTTKGLLLPRMTTTQRDAISSPPSGLVIYNTTTGKINVRGASAWEAITST